ncbi:MAG: carotenoid biosynthesis protein [Chloroflexota bacterium]|nr:carotenoid biosynthesis protein [Chloroflexota bacterium]
MHKHRLTTTLLWVYAALTIYALLSPWLHLPKLPFVTSSGLTVLAFVFALMHASQRMGWERALLFVGLAFCIGLLFESVGVLTGLIYGPYHYTTHLGPRFLGLVPYAIPMAWFMMMYPSYVIAERLIPTPMKKWRWRLSVAALGGIVMTAWDVVMDPMMVAGGNWVWEVEGAYFGVPLQNYWGWWLTSFVTLALFAWLGRIDPTQPTSQPNNFDRLAVFSYAITALGNMIAALLIGLAGPALAGLFAMGPWVMLSLREREEGCVKRET